MSETVQVTFQYAIGQWVRWAEQPGVRWRVIERVYREGYASPFVRYRLHAAGDTQDAMAYEPDLASGEGEA